eukprot:756804-Hanusia_phi.AAC.2
MSRPLERVDDVSKKSAGTVEGENDDILMGVGWRGDIGGTEHLNNLKPRFKTNGHGKYRVHTWKLRGRGTQGKGYESCGSESWVG